MRSLRFIIIAYMSIGLQGLSLLPWRRRAEYRRFLSPEEMGIADGLNDTAVHVHFMKGALEQAENAEKRGEVPIGALLVQHNGDRQYKILADGYNLVETTSDASAHAELMALRRAAKRVKNWRLSNTTLYTTLEPCPMCLSAAQAFRVSSIVYGAPDLRLGAVETHIQLLDMAKHPFHTIDQVVPRVLEEESASRLRKFFRRRRTTSRSDIERPLELTKIWKQKLQARGVDVRS